MSSAAAFSVLDVFYDSDESSILSIDDAPAITGRQAAATGPPDARARIPTRIAQSPKKKYRKIPPKPKAAAAPAPAAAAGAGNACSSRPKPKPSGRPRKIRPIVGSCSLQLYAAAMQFHQTHTKSVIWYPLRRCWPLAPPAVPPRAAAGCRVYVQLFALSPRSIFVTFYQLQHGSQCGGVADELGGLRLHAACRAATVAVQATARQRSRMHEASDAARGRGAGCSVARGMS